MSGGFGVGQCRRRQVCLSKPFLSTFRCARSGKKVPVRFNARHAFEGRCRRLPPVFFLRFFQARFLGRTDRIVRLTGLRFKGSRRPIGSARSIPWRSGPVGKSIRAAGLEIGFDDPISAMHRAVALVRTAFLLVGRRGGPFPAGGQEKPCTCPPFVNLVKGGYQS